MDSMIKFITFVPILILMTSKLVAEFSQTKIDELDSTLQSWVNSKKYAGIVNLTYIEGEIEHFKAYGYKDLTIQAPMTTDTIFRIYSMTKPVVSVAIMQLVEKGKIQLDSPINDYIPEFRQLKVYADGNYQTPREPITLKHLLTHTAGFSYGWTDHPVDLAYKEINLLRNNIKGSDDFIKKVSKAPLIYHPGEKWHYSIATDLIGILIERISDMSLEAYLKENLFNPLGMNDTGFSLPLSKKNRFCTNYRNVNGQLKVEDSFKNSRYYKVKPYHSGGGGLVSTAEDYLKFAQMLLNEGTYQGKRYLKKGTIDLMTQNHLLDTLEDPNDPWSEHSFELDDPYFGLGFKLTIVPDKRDGKPLTKQYSWNGAAGTEFWIDPVESLINITLIQKMDSDWMLRENMEKLIY